MIDANSQFFAILTDVGMAKQANADALGIPWLITQMGVGDANPNGLADPPNPVPSASQTKLLNEWRCKPLNQLKIDPINPAVIIAEQIIPADEGGKWIREIGLYDADGDLVAVANCAPSFKPLLSQGSGRTQIVRMNFIVSSTGNIQLKIDPAIVLASRAYVDAAILEVLPKNKAAGQYTRVKVNDRGVFVSGDNPETLAGMGIKDTYTKPEIEAMIAQASALPVGATVAFPLDKVAPGFLELDGSVKSIAVYPDLAAFLGTAFNKGDEGAGNFRLPDSRGEFLRGWDHGREVDAGRAVGSWQVGTATYGDGDGQNLPVPNMNNAAHVRVLGLEYDTAPAVSEPVTVLATATATVSLSMEGVQTPGTAYGGVDFMRSRPRNIAVVWCIKAWNAPINQGNIDIAALAALATQATEIKLGTAKIATQAQTVAGTDDATIVTPKKLRLGFLSSLTPNGYVVFPSWLGGFTIQWGLGSYVDKTPISFTLAYANACFVVLATDGTVATAAASDVVPYGAAPDTLLKTGFMLRSSLGAIGGNVFWISVGS
ncbi:MULTISPECIES: phage tail-collar fiber domain-containing protein [unclassified Pseudomonas]|uniref:phage tail-collar fiber domain-containing protein n=1 Tax=unclassified Pseudomonas TaxID=196821 RepID=UPI00215CA6C3|nr:MULTISPECIES: phage tail protein [unclassified Pseudomonas]MCR8931138.1 phage tail protein [Pseudomonas sp. S11A4]MCR8974747.1 phage tail protein [Pseudomonas sp. S11P7]